MSNPITVGLSGLTNRIFAGRSKASKLAPGVRKFVGEKFDVTDEALFAVAHLLIARDDVLVFPAANGKEIHLRADLKDKPAVVESKGGCMTAQLPSKELLKATIADWEAAREEIPFGLGEEGDNTLAALKFALAAHEQEPVYQVFEPSDGRWVDLDDEEEMIRLRSIGGEVRTLYAHPAPSIPAAVPEERTWLFYCEKYPEMPMGDAIIRAVEWNACRAAMLSGGKS